MDGNELTKKYYRINDVAEMLDLPLSTLRFWEKEFSELRPRRTGTRTRLYTPRDIELLELIKFLLKERGLKIDAARNYIRHNRADLDRRHQVVRRLQGVRNQLLELLATLDSRK
ncbi:MAG: MerR family transcriptional regulator [Muribaculaceae bacterium]|nr:MerR family transcriptional regulator [Muribaculaceae bacterium]